MKDRFPLPSDNKRQKKSPLNNQQRAQLKGLARSLQPILRLGKAGLKEPHFQDLAKAFKKQSLVKIRWDKALTDKVPEILQTIETRLNCLFVQKVGRVAVFYQRSAADLISGLASEETPSR